MWEWNFSVFLTRAKTPVKILRTYCSKSTFFFWKGCINRLTNDGCLPARCVLRKCWLIGKVPMPQGCCVSFHSQLWPAWKSLLEGTSGLSCKSWNIEPFKTYVYLTLYVCAYYYTVYATISFNLTKNPIFTVSLSHPKFFAARLQRKKTDLPLVRPNGWVPIRPRFGWLLKPMLETSVGSFGWSTGLGSFGVHKFQGFQGSYILDVNMNHMNIIHNYGNMIMYVYYKYNYWLYMSMICIYINTWCIFVIAYIVRVCSVPHTYTFMNNAAKDCKAPQWCGP